MSARAAYCTMFDGTPTGTSPERWNMCRCSRPLRTRTCTQPWHGAIVVRGVLPAPRTWYWGIHGETKCVRSPGSSRICSTRCGNWSNARTLAGREVVERPAVGAGADVARRQAALGGLLRSRPGVPPVAAELAQLVQGGGAVDERAQLADRLAPEGRDAAVGDHREAVGSGRTAWSAASGSTPTGPGGSGVFSPSSRMRASRSRYCVSGTRWSNGSYRTPPASLLFGTLPTGRRLTRWTRGSRRTGPSPAARTR